MLTCALLLAVAGAADAADVQQLRLHAAPDHVRIVFDLSGPVDWTHVVLKNPERVVVDLASSTLSFNVARLGLDGTEIQAIRSGRRGADGLRVVFDLSRPFEPRPFVLKPVPPYGHRLVLDLYDPEVQHSPSVPVREGKRAVVVAIDAGHGGDDPGALGADGVREKDVVLAIARHLDKLFDMTPGFRGELVRSGDYYVPLRRRTQLARKAGADMFVSIHADAFQTPQPQGASVYTLSRRGATSGMGRWLTELESQSDLIGGVDKVGRDPLLAMVVMDVRLDGIMPLSLDAGKRVLDRLGTTKRVHSNEVHQANFVVLRSPDIPSILVETGFISNPQEARELATPAHQARIAQAVFLGVRAHLEDKPPDGTLLAWRIGRLEQERRYAVERGDTLSGIAQRFGIGVARLKLANDLSGDVIHVGQVLVIPAS